MSKSLAKSLALLVRGLTSPLKRQRRDIVLAMVSQDLIVEPVCRTRHGDIRFHCPNKEALEYPRDLLSREADTIEWIDGFADGDVFWDIGANVGAYSLYAALVTKSKVLAFEPSASSFALLVRNVEINGLDDLISPYCLALSDRTMLAALNMSHTYASSVNNVFGSDIDLLGNRIDVSFRQSVAGFSMDDFAATFQLSEPNHIKIDVDSIEPEIIEGGRKLLAAPGVKSVLVEVDKDIAADRRRRIIGGLADAGLVSPDTDTDSGRNNVIFRRV